MRSSLLLGSAVLVFLCPSGIHGQQQSDLNHRIEQGISLIKLGCGTGTSSGDVKVTGNLSGLITVTKLPGVSAGASVVYSKDEAEGLLAALKKEVDAGTLTFSEKQLDCMKPYVDAIFRELFPPPKPEQPVSTRPDQRVFKICFGDGGGANCLAGADVRLDCSRYHSWTAQKWEELAAGLCGTKTPSYLNAQIQFNDGGGCGWTAYRLTCN